MKSFAFITLIGVMVLGSACSSSGTPPDDVVARVNGQDIKKADLDRQFDIRIKEAERPPSPDEAEDLKLQLLSQMINDQILLEMAAQSNLTASDAEVDVKLNEYKSQYTEEAFQKLLKDQSLSVDDMKTELRKSVTIDKLVNKEITSKISVSEAEIQDYFNKNKEGFNLPDSFHVAHILVTPVADPGLRNGKNDDAKTPEEARRKAASLLRQVQEGADFATVARDYSEDPSSGPMGGNLNFQPLQAFENINPRFGQAVQRLKVGETFPQTVESQFGFHIIKLLEREAGGQKDLGDPRVTTQIRQAIFSRKDQTLKAAFFEIARNKARIENYLAQRVFEGAGKSQ